MFKRKRSYEEGPDSQMQTSHLSDLPYSRTMKRTRDRPSEESIHQRTLDLLSKGAVLDMQAPKTAQDAQAPQQLSHASTVARPQRSLHNFWNIPSAPSSTPAGSAPVVIAMATSCDNCKGPLRPGNNNGIDQDCCDVVISCNPTDLPDSACGQCRRNHYFTSPFATAASMSFPKGLRPASHAGTWYKENGTVLSTELDGNLQNVPQSIDDTTLPVANARMIIAPHAGYSYSGPCAAWAYKCLDLRNVKRVFVLGPSHTYYLSGCALSTADSYETPFGNLRVDTDTIAELTPLINNTMPPHNEVREHSLEMHMPYLYKQLEAVHGSDDAATAQFPGIVPILVGDMETAEEKRIGGILAPYLRDPHTAVIVSSDFCHWGTHFRYQMYASDGTLASLKPLKTQPGKDEPRIHETIRMIDTMAMDAIETGEIEKFKEVLKTTENTICGRHPIAVAMAAMAELDPQRAFKFVRYEQSAQVTKISESSVSYASAYAVLG